MLKVFKTTNFQIYTGIPPICLFRTAVYSNFKLGSFSEVTRKFPIRFRSFPNHQNQNSILRRRWVSCLNGSSLRFSVEIIMDPVIDPFKSLLLSIANDVSKDDFTNMKFLCSGCIAEGRLEAIEKPQQLFTELIHECHLSSDKKNYLASLLFHIGRHDLKNRLLGQEGEKLLLFPPFVIIS